MLTFRDIKDANEVQAVAKFCPDSPEFAGLINQVTRQMARRGDWFGTLVPLYTCAHVGCITWPRIVQAVRSVRLCQRNVQTRNIWGDFLPVGHGWNRDLNYLQGYGMYGGECTMTRQANTSVFQDIMGEGRLVRAYCRCPQDYGKTVRIFGLDDNGQPLQERDINGNWIAGNTITLQQSFGSTASFVRQIDYALKDPTQCPINLYAYNATTNVLEDLAQYDPTETVPSYERSRLGGGPMGQSCATGTCCSKKQPLIALVKLRFIPVVADTDLVLIDNIDALVLQIQSTKSREAGDIQSAQAFQAMAVESLNRELEDNSPDAQFSADGNTFGPGVSFTNHCF